MKKKTSLILLIGIVVLLLLTFSPVKSLLFGYKKNQSNSAGFFSSDQDKKRDSTPLLILTSYFNSVRSISRSQLRKMIEQGKVSCTKDIAGEVKDLFALAHSPRITFLHEADLSSDSLLILTGIDSVDHRFLALSLDSVNFFKDPTAYPLWHTYEADRSFNFSQDITSYTHTGVTAITRSTGYVLDQIGIDKYLENMLPFFQRPDWVHISNEVSMSDSLDYRGMKMKFATKARDFEIIKRLRTTMVELTGNHNLDFGKDIYIKTLDWYQKNQIAYFGGGKTKNEAATPLIRSLRTGEKVAWVGFNELCPCGECADRPGLDMGANRYNRDAARRIIDQLKNTDNVNYVIACVQFGERDSYQPSESQKTISRDLIDFGADVVIGSQAHQAQEIALYKNKPIFYGLGNFLFDQIHRLGVRQAFFLECFFYKGKIIQFQPVYTFMGLNRIPALATETDIRDIKSAILKKGNFKGQY